MNPHNPPSQDCQPLIKPNRYSPFSKNLPDYYLYFGKRKSIIKKYYARKILYVEKNTDLTAATNRIKYFLHFKITSWYISYLNFKSLANSILLNKDIRLNPLRYRWQGPSFQSLSIHPLQLKKTLRSCKNPQSVSPCFPQPSLKHLQHLFHLKSLTLHVTDASSMSKASKAIRKLHLLQSLHVRYISDYDGSCPNLPIKLKGKCIISDPDDKKGWGFFYKISKLPRLQRFSLQISLRTLEGQSSAVQQDFADFYSRSHKFKLDTEVYVSSSLDIQELTSKNMASILKTADSLSVHLGVSKPVKKNPYTCQETKLSEQENKKILKQGNRPVKFSALYKEKLQVNIGCLLAKCENLTSLYLRVSGAEIFWDQDYGDLSSKLHTVVLDVDFLGLKYEILDDRRPSRFKIEEEIYEVSGQRKVKFHSGLLELLKQLKTRAVGLGEFTLFICLANFKKSWYRPKDFQELFEKMIEEKMKNVFEELESFEKFHRIHLCQKPGFLDESLNRALAAKSLQTVNVRSCCSNL